MTAFFNALAYILGWAVLVPALLFILAVIACNVFDWAQSAWAKIKREWAPTGWLDDL